MGMSVESVVDVVFILSASFSSTFSKRKKDFCLSLKNERMLAETSCIASHRTLSSVFQGFLSIIF